MLNISFVFESYSKYGPSIEEVLFNEVLSLTDIFGPKMASKLMLDALSLGATLDLKNFSDLRCMYKFEV